MLSSFGLQLTIAIFLFFLVFTYHFQVAFRAEDYDLRHDQSALSFLYDPQYLRQHSPHHFLILVQVFLIGTDCNQGRITDSSKPAHGP